MLGLLALLVVAAVVCVRLGAWQIDRAYATSQAAAEAQAEELLMRRRVRCPRSSSRVLTSWVATSAARSR